MSEKEIEVIKLMKENDFELVENEVELLIFEHEYKGSLNLWYNERIVFNRTYKVVRYTIDSDIASIGMEELKLIYTACSYLGWIKESKNNE